MKDIECPYCGHWQDVDHDGGQGYEENVRHEMKCEECDKSFTFSTSISFNYESEKAECLNDGNHIYKLSITCPKVFSTMNCTMCDEKRELTEQERIEFNIQTKENYFKQLKK